MKSVNTELLADSSSPQSHLGEGPKSEVAKDLNWHAFIRKWHGTLRFAREQREPSHSFARTLPTRLGALKPIRRPVFVLGCPRSGTTFLGSVLGSLPSASYYFEPKVVKYYTRLVYEKRVSHAQARRFYRLSLRSLLLVAPGNGQRIIEKNPNHTWIARTLREIFPDAQFVMITRDGRDTALSLLKKPWHLFQSASTGRREPGGYLFGPYPHFYIEPHRTDEYSATSDFHRCIWIWRAHTEQIERLRFELPPECQYHLRYESLVSDPRAELEALLRFMGENDAESRLRVFERAALARDDSVGRWQGQLTKADMDTVEREAGEFLRNLGYT